MFVDHLLCAGRVLDLSLDWTANFFPAQDTKIKESSSGLATPAMTKEGLHCQEVCVEHRKNCT